MIYNASYMNFKKVALFLLMVALFGSIAATYYKTVIQKDFEIIVPVEIEESYETE